jgi:ubiquinone/menaquinone biosynthesis C-methylase UbiE
MDQQKYSEIKTYWDQKAAAQGNDPHFTLPDYNLRNLEAEYVIRHLKPEDHLLDIGCGNGTTTLRFSKCVRQVVGADYSANMIENALKLHPAANIEYQVMDVMKIDAPNSKFDAVVTERCLINLPDWPSQQIALGEIARVLKPKGRYLMCESFEEAFVKFADLRTRFGLEPMKRHLNNYCLREAWLKEFLPKYFRVVSIEKMGLFYLISRLVHPMLAAPREPQYEATINEIAVKLTMGMDPHYLEDISVNGLYVLERI